MFPLTKVTVIKVSGLSQIERIKIDAYLISLVNKWFAKKGKEWFAARNLVGGDNADWNGTDLQVLYDKHIKLGKTPTQAKRQAGIDLGKLLKVALNSDPRDFEIRDGYTKEYKFK